MEILTKKRLGIWTDTDEKNTGLRLDQLLDGSVLVDEGGNLYWEVEGQIVPLHINIAVDTDGYVACPQCGLTFPEGHSCGPRGIGDLCQGCEEDTPEE